MFGVGILRATFNNDGTNRSLLPPCETLFIFFLQNATFLSKMVGNSKIMCIFAA